MIISRHAISSCVHPIRPQPRARWPRLGDQWVDEAWPELDCPLSTGVCGRMQTDGRMSWDKVLNGNGTMFPSPIRLISKTYGRNWLLTPEIWSNEYARYTVHILSPWNKKKQTYIPGYDWKCRVLGACAIDAGHRASDTNDTCCRLATWRKYRAWAQRNQCIVENEVTYEADKNNIWKVINTLSGSKSVAIASSDSKILRPFHSAFDWIGIGCPN